MNQNEEKSPLHLRAEQIRGQKVIVYPGQDPFLPVAEAFCPLPESHDAKSPTLSLLFIWAHYPDLSVIGFVTLSSPIRAAAFCCTSHKLLFRTTSYTLPHREIEMEIRDTKEINAMQGPFLEALQQMLTYCSPMLRLTDPFPTLFQDAKILYLKIRVLHSSAFESH